jgi:hypothetical protein
LYQRFAEAEAQGRSPLYEQLALEIAGDESPLEFLSALPRPKQQPNLLFAAVRYVCGTSRDWEHFHTSLLTNHNKIREVMMKRRTQTNEPARCATLLPLFALLPQASVRWILFRQPNPNRGYQSRCFGRRPCGRSRFFNPRDRFDFGSVRSAQLHTCSSVANVTLSR